VAQYDAALDPRESDGVMTYGEKLALYYGLGAPNNTLFEVPLGLENNSVRMILVKQSGISYADVNPRPALAPLKPDNIAKLRGISTGEVFARDLKTPLQIALAIAHEVGHILDLATAAEESGSGPYTTGSHDQPPYARCVHEDNPNGLTPVHPGNELDVARPYPNRSLMAGGAPEDDGLPWLHGRWMRSQDWEKANLSAGGGE
jgi:hypothetical protein